MQWNWELVLGTVNALAALVSAAAAAFATYYAYQSIVGAQRLEEDRRATMRPYLNPTDAITDNQGFHIRLTNVGTSHATSVAIFFWGIQMHEEPTISVTGAFSAAVPHDLYVGALSDLTIGRGQGPVVDGNYLAILITYRDTQSNKAYNQTVFYKVNRVAIRGQDSFAWQPADTDGIRRSREALAAVVVWREATQATP
jgi:hypothetical protein